MPTADVFETIGEIIPDRPQPIIPENSPNVSISGRERLKLFNTTRGQEIS